MLSDSQVTATNRPPKRTPRATLSWRDVQRVAVEAMVADKTVYRWARGEHVNSMTNARISRAMNKLGIEVA
jgi:hypothetical protein